MLTADALIDWSFLKSVISNLSEDDQNYYEILINAASVTANRYARRKLAAREQEVILDGSGLEYIVLPDPPVNSVDSVFIDAEREFGSDTEIEETFYPEKETGLLFRIHGKVWDNGTRNIKVIYNSGFEETPADLQLAVVEVVVYNSARMRNSLIGAKTMNSGDGMNIEHEITIPANAQRVFQSYTVEEP